MAKIVFADRYAAEGLAPSAEDIAAREAPFARIVEEITDAHILDLVSLYYGATDLDLVWFREEFAKEDTRFSLVNNERETRLLAATILEELIGQEVHLSILGVVAGSVGGHRVPAQSKNLITVALEAMGRQSVDERKPAKAEVKIVSVPTPKLSEELAAVPANDWPALITMLGRIRNEALTSTKTTAGQATAALTELNRQIALQREESQMLWWIVGGHSRTLERSFGAFGINQAALVGAVDLGDLTSVTRLGPVAALALLERVIGLAKRSKGTTPNDLATTIDGLSREDLQRLNIFPEDTPARLAPIMTAIELARTIGHGAWHGRFFELTGLQATLKFEPTELAVQLYREHLLGQLI